MHPAGEAHSERFHQRLTRSFNIQGPGEAAEPGWFVGGLAAHLASRVYAAFLDGDGDRAESLLYELMKAMKRDEWEIVQNEPKWLWEAREQLRESILGRTSLFEIATRLGVSPSHLATAFRRFHRCTAGDYVRRLRVEHACRKIAGGAELAGVALDAGFCDQSHFTRAFRQVMGVTPGEYRAML
ncbi:MAG: helix-turn-helix transcriptional regulator [Bryobacterales bacterium]|nr:helix-turn-helix transcriptional regulator [Bryobacterales bacterium]